MRFVALFSTALVASALHGVMPILAQDEICIACVTVRVGPPMVVRGPFPDEIDAPFSALRLEDGSFRGFSANGSTYAIDGASIDDMGGERREVLQAGEPDSLAACGRWLTSLVRSGDDLLGMVHQEGPCDYRRGQTHKSMAIAKSSDDGLNWTDLGEVITGIDRPQPVGITGEGDCTMIDGTDGFLYAYCLRNSDWQTIVARASLDEPTDWRKYFEGAWSEPGLGGRATAIGFLGTGAAYVDEQDWVATVTTDPWYSGLRLSLSSDKVSFLDLDEPLLTIDGSDWDRPAGTDLSVYATLLNPNDGSSAIGGHFILSYLYVPPGAGFETRYLVHHAVSLEVEAGPVDVNVGMALSRWADTDRTRFVASTGPMTGDRLGYDHDATIAYMLTRAPDDAESVRLAECSLGNPGTDQMVAQDGYCATSGFQRDRTAGWLFAMEQPGTVPVFQCVTEPDGRHFVSGAVDCEGLGRMDNLLGYGLAP